LVARGGASLLRSAAGSIRCLPAPIETARDLGYDATTNIFLTV
jgi:hypothetical protein